MSPADQTELAFAGALELSAHVRARQVSARELVELFLRRIEVLDPQLNAFRVVLADDALAAADAHDRSGVAADAGPLAGVPFAVKDDTPLAGQEMTRGSLAPVAPQVADAEIVSKLRAAGAIPIGITNVPELMLFPWTASSANGVTRNPWDTTRTPGGSSGGSAAAVAAGLVPIATGSDGGGSIRIPAACCGLVGLKPTRGRVSTQPLGADALGLSIPGMLARTVAESALLLDVISGTGAGASAGLAPPDQPFFESVRKASGRPLRVAISKKLPPGSFAPLSADQRLAFDRTARLLAELGHQVEEASPRYGSGGLDFIQTYLRAAHEEFGTLSDPGVAERSTRQLAAIGGAISASRRDRLLASRGPTAARIERFWDQYDVLLTPGLARTAIAAEGAYGRSAAIALYECSRFMPWFPVFNLTGQPALSLPSGFGVDGLPLSVQLVGRAGDEATLLALGSQLEVARPWAADRPPVGR